jgi:hypothetical protein
MYFPTGRYDEDAHGSQCYTLIEYSIYFIDFPIIVKFAHHCPTAAIDLAKIMNSQIVQSNSFESSILRSFRTNQIAICPILVSKYSWQCVSQMKVIIQYFQPLVSERNSCRFICFHVRNLLFFSVKVDAFSMHSWILIFRALIYRYPSHDFFLFLKFLHLTNRVTFFTFTAYYLIANCTISD